MSPSRGPEGGADWFPPAFPPNKRQRTLSFRLDDPPAGSKRSSSIRRASEAHTKRSRQESSSPSSWDEDRPQSLGSTSQVVLTGEPESIDGLPLATRKPTPRGRRTTSLRSPTLDDSPNGRHPSPVTRSFTMQPVRRVDWDRTSSDDVVDETRQSSPKRRRERARSWLANGGPPGSPTLNGRHTERPQSASSPSIAHRAHFGGSALRNVPSSGSSDARPVSPANRTLSFESRRAIRVEKPSKRKEAEARPRLLSELVLPSSSTHESLADVAPYGPLATPMAEAPAPAPQEPTLKELIESVPLDQALSLYQSVNRGTQRQLHEPAFPTSLRPTSPLSQGQSVESGTSQKPLLPSHSPESSPEKHKRDVKKSLSLHFGSGKSKKAHKEAPLPTPLELPPLTPTVTADRGSRSAPERQFEDLISRAHLQTSPVTFARANECRQYIEARYDPLFDAISHHRAPPNLLEVSRWRTRVREKQVHHPGLAMSTSSGPVVRTEIALVAGKPLPHRNKRTRCFEIYPDETLAFLEAASSPHDKSPTQSLPLMNAPGRRKSVIPEETTDSLPPLPGSKDSYASSIYGPGKSSERGSTVSLPQSRHRSPSVSSVPGVTNGAMRHSPPMSPRSKLFSSIPHSTVSIPKALAKFGHLGRTFKHHRDRTQAAGQRSAGSGSDAPLSPSMSETDHSDVEAHGGGKLRHSGSKADSIARRGWRNFRGGADHGSLHKIERRDSTAPSILGGHISDNDTMADLGSLLEDDFEADLLPPLPVLDIDDEEEQRLNDLLGEANRAISTASAFVPKCPSKIAMYMEQLTAYDVASRVTTRLLTLPPLQMPTLPPDIALEVQRAARAERILRPSQQDSEDEHARVGPSAALPNKIVEEPEDISSEGSYSSESEHSEEVHKSAEPISAASERQQTWPRMRGPLRRQSLNVLTNATSAPMEKQTSAESMRRRRMTVATEHPQQNLGMSMRPDPLPGVIRTVQAYEQILLSSGRDAVAGTSEVHAFWQRVFLGNRSAAEYAAELGGSTQELSHLNEMMGRQEESDVQHPMQDLMWSGLEKLLVLSLRTVSVCYTLCRMILIPVRLIWAVIVVLFGLGRH